MLYIKEGGRSKERKGETATERDRYKRDRVRPRKREREELQKDLRKDKEKGKQKRYTS